MKKLWKKFKTNVLLGTVIILALFVISHIILKLLSIRYRQWVYYTVILLTIIGIIVGAIQILRKKGKTAKIITLIIGTIIALFIIVFWRLFLLLFAFSYCPEHIIKIGEKKYVAYVRSFLRVDVYYYDYINFFLVGNKIKIQEYYGKGGYDPFDGKHNQDTPVNTTFYDDNGNVISDNNASQIQKTNNQGILYEKQFDNDTKIRVVVKDYILAQRLLIGIEKTTDNGNTWMEQPGVVQIHDGSKFVFIDENIGFINDPGLAGTGGDNRCLLVTTDGGNRYTEAIINQNNSGKKLYIDDVPFIEDNVLKLKAHSSKSEEYYFYSENKGISWKEVE